jgi:hypothetical protein
MASSGASDAIHRGRHKLQTGPQDPQPVNSGSPFGASLRRFVDAKTRTWINFLRTYLPAVIARDEALLAHVARGTPLQVNGTFPLVS